MFRVGWIVGLLAIATFAHPSSVLAQDLERGLPPCSDEAVSAAKAGAQNEEPAALYRLARYYSSGKCVPGNGPEAIRLYQRAAALGYAPAYYNLGIVAAGGAQDFTEAEADFLKGAGLGHRGCELMLGILYATTPPVLDNIKAYAWLSLSLSRTPPADTGLANKLLGDVDKKLSAEERQKADDYLGQLKAQYGPTPAFRP